MGPNKGNTATFIKYLLSKHFKFDTLVRSFAKLSSPSPCLTQNYINSFSGVNKKIWLTKTIGSQKKAGWSSQYLKIVSSSLVDHVTNLGDLEEEKREKLNDK